MTEPSPQTVDDPPRAEAPSRAPVTPLWLETARFAAVCGSLALLGWAFRDVPGPDAFRQVVACAPPVAEHPDVRWIEQEDARALVEAAGVVFVDARSLADFETGHVPDAIAMPMDTGVLDPRVLPLTVGSTVVAYCDTNDDCAGSRRLAGLLAENGVTDVRVLRGGMPLWLSNDYPAESGPCTRCP